MSDQDPIDRNAETDNPENSTRKPTDLEWTNWFFLFFVGAALVTVYFQLIGSTLRVCYIGVPFLWALACLAVGAALGFLFGIPKVKNRDKQNAASIGKDDPDNGYNSEVNTNLIEISDWLTKIIVGLGLIDFKEIPGLLKRIARPLADCLPCDCAMAFALGIVVCFTVAGFLFGYLYTRLFIAIMLDIADRTLTGKLKKVIREKSKLKEENSAMSAEVASADAERKVKEGSDTDFQDFLKKITKETPLTEKKGTAKTLFTAVGEPVEPFQQDDPLGPTKRRVLNLARESAKADSPQIRQEKIYEIARLATPGSALRTWLADVAAERFDQTLVAALGYAINALPQPNDLSLLLKVSPLATTPVAQNGVLVALTRLFRDTFATKQDVPAVASAIGLYPRSADPEVKKQLQGLLSLIRTKTGIPVSLQ